MHEIQIPVIRITMYPDLYKKMQKYIKEKKKKEKKD